MIDPGDAISSSTALSEPVPQPMSIHAAPGPTPSHGTKARFSTRLQRPIERS